MSAGPRSADERKLAYGLAGMLTAVGVLHFAAPKPFDSIVPAELPGSARFYTQASGVAELGTAALLAVPRTRRFGATAAMALFLAVFPANVNMVIHPELGGTLPHWTLWLRLPFQVLFIVYALWVTEALPAKKAATLSPAP